MHLPRVYLSPRSEKRRTNFFLSRSRAWRRVATRKIVLRLFRVFVRTTRPISRKSPRQKRNTFVQWRLASSPLPSRYRPSPEKRRSLESRSHFFFSRVSSFIPFVSLLSSTFAPSTPRETLSREVHLMSNRRVGTRLSDTYSISFASQANGDPNFQKIR